MFTSWASRLSLCAMMLVLLVSACGAPVSSTGESPSLTLPQSPTVKQTDTPPGVEKVPESMDIKIMQSKLPRDNSPEVPEEDQLALVLGNSEFAFDFYHAVSGEDGNLFFSPHSLSTVLAMTYAGANGDTASQMASTLHFYLPQEDLHPAFNALDLTLVGGELEDGDTQAPDIFQLSMTNSLWGQRDYPFLPAFLDILALNYGAGLRLVDFVSAPEAARQEINFWVEEQTQEKIKDLVPPGAINSLTTLVLANAVYFKADWQHPFSPDLTQPGEFYPLEGAPIQTPMMALSQAMPLAYSEGPGYQAVELPYVGDRITMLVLVPDQGKFTKFEAGLVGSQIIALEEGLVPTRMKLSMPKFSFESGYSIADTLAGIGMVDAFDARAADFSGMDGTRSLFISDVFHKAFVAVDEKGTEAAAATAVIMGKTALMQPELELIIDRPFIFLIRDKVTGAILFMGRVSSPVAESG